MSLRASPRESSTLAFGHWTLDSHQMPKAEVSWKRTTEDGEKLQVTAQRVGGEWRFSQRGKRYDTWTPVPEPPLEDWMELLDAVERLINRRRLQPYRG